MFNLAVGSLKPLNVRQARARYPECATRWVGGARVIFAKIDIVNAIGQTSAQEGLGTPYRVLR
jgi:hypothetical protein